MPFPRIVAAAPLSWLLAMLLGGCSGTPFGEALSGSFSSANPATSSPEVRAPAPSLSPPASPGPVPSQPAQPKPAQPKPAQPKPVQPPPGSSKPVSKAPEPAGASRPAPPDNPAPYRVTILLPQADPAAPAEVVTRALRTAGVPFEVETIQRTGGPASPAPAAPSVRSAPPPS
jgi:hypothetical protein